jgi:hypothetical protein
MPTPSPLKPASSQRIDKLRRLVAALEQRSMGPDAVMDLLQVSYSAARNYLSELAQAGIADPDPERHTVMRLHPDLQVRERFLAALSERLGQARVSLRRSPSRHCMDSSGSYLHVLADDASFPLVLHQDPVRRDPLVAALFGAANNRAPVVKGETLAMN